MLTGIRTNAAAELLGVSPNTLRSWERRFRYPRPRRTAGGHRLYSLSDLEALRRALLETHNISSAVQLARQRGEGPSSSTRLLETFDAFDDVAADRVMEESLIVRSVERTVEEVLMPALELARGRPNREAEFGLARHWAQGWLHGARRVVPPASRRESFLMLDSSSRLHLESLHAQALELALRRAGFRVLPLSIGFDPERVARVMRALDPAAIVVNGVGATPEQVARLVEFAEHTAERPRLFEYRDSIPSASSYTIPSLGSKPTEAVERVRTLIEGPGTHRRASDEPPDEDASEVDGTGDEELASSA